MLLPLQPWQQVGFQRHPSFQTALVWERVSRWCLPDDVKNSQSSWKTSPSYSRSLTVLFIFTCNSPRSHYRNLCMGSMSSRCWRCAGTQHAARAAWGRQGLALLHFRSQSLMGAVWKWGNTPCPGSTFNLLSVLRQFAPDLGAWLIPFNSDSPHLTWRVPEHKGGCKAHQEHPACLSTALFFSEHHPHLPLGRGFRSG